MLDFTNTVDSRGIKPGPDVLGSFGDLRAWALRRGIIDTPDAEGLASLPGTRSRRALASAKTFREALYRMFSGQAILPVDLDLVEHAFQTAQRARRLTKGFGGYAWQWQADDPNTITHRIALSATDLLTGPALDRVHVCPGENCHWLFLDTSRSGRRIWCSDETCGRRNRIRRWRAKQLDK